VLRSDKVDQDTISLILNSVVPAYLGNNVLRSDKVDVVTLDLTLQLLMTTQSL
jgi:hypothetical protein